MGCYAPATFTIPRDAWAGGLELEILSEYYKVQFVAVDIITVKAFRFGARRCDWRTGMHM